MRGPNGVATPSLVERKMQTDEAEGRPNGRDLIARMLGAVGIQGELMEPTELGKMVELMAHHAHVELPAGGRRVGARIDRPVADRECQATAWTGARRLH